MWRTMLILIAAALAIAAAQLRGAGVTIAKVSFGIAREVFE